MFNLKREDQSRGLKIEYKLHPVFLQNGAQHFILSSEQSSTIQDRWKLYLEEVSKYQPVRHYLYSLHDSLLNVAIRSIFRFPQNKKWHFANECCPTTNSTQHVAQRLVGYWHRYWHCYQSILDKNMPVLVKISLSVYH